MARARAAADEVEQARVDMLAVRPKLPPPLPDPLPDWPETEPFNEALTDQDIAPHVMSVMQKKLAVARSTPAKGSTAVSPPRSTVIPVPTLPTAVDPRTVRPAPHTPSAPRIARGTGTQQKKPVIEETVRTMAAPPPANDDRTSPYIELPPEVKPSGFTHSHTRRVAAKQR